MNYYSQRFAFCGHWRLRCHPGVYLCPAATGRSLSRLLLVAVLFIATGRALAASFDCTKKLNQTETLICGDAELSKMDSALADAYAAATKKIHADQRDDLRNDQRVWLAHRNATCKLSDMESAANRRAGTSCLMTLITRRIEALQATAKTGFQPAIEKKGENSIQIYRRGADDKLELVLQPDGTTDLSIETQSARGVCGASLSGARPAQGVFVFHDKESSCTVTLAVADNAARVNSTGDCSSYCGVHADFVGIYNRTKVAAQNRVDAAFVPVTIENCGKPLVMDVKNPAQFKQFSVDLSAYRKNEASKYAKVVSDLCNTSAAYRVLVEHKVDKISLINAQGAMEPTPYLLDKTLVIEFAGGTFDAKDFDRALRRALDGKPPVFRD